MNRRAALVCLALAGCVTPPESPQARLKPGSWVEAKGRMVNGKPLVDEIDELARTESDKAEKVEVTAAAQPISDTELQLVGIKLARDAETEFEDDKKKAIDPFMPKDGEWVRAKLRSKDGVHKLRTLRKSENREQFKVEGELSEVNMADSELVVGGIKLPFVQGASIGTLNDRASDDPLALFKADDQKGVPFTIQATDSLFLGGSGSFDYTEKDEYDLDRVNERDQQQMSGSMNLDLLYLFPDKASYAIFEGGGGRSDTDNDSPTRQDTSNETKQVTRAAVSLAIAQKWQLLMGRTDFEDEREWLFDRTLDGFRLIYNDGPWRFDLGGAYGRDFLATANSTENTQIGVTMLRYRMDPDWWIGAYLLGRNDSGPLDHEPVLYGLRSIDERKYGFSHSAELGFAGGHSRWAINNSNRANDEQAVRTEGINGWAFDVMAKYTFENDWRPNLLVGYAYGSGEKDSSSQMGYRQSGYHDNNGKIGGVTSIRYYGDVFRPELSNIAIFTAAASFRPFENSALSVIYHTYVQDYASQTQPLSDMRIGSGSIPNGRDPLLGSEIDLVFGYRGGFWTFEAVLGRFEPGPAFDNQDPATKFDMTLRFSF